MTTATFPIRILLVDDDIDDCMFFRDALNETGLPTSLKISAGCPDFKDFPVNNDDNLPHLIFLDLHMPKITGSECLETLRSLAYFNSIPIIIYSTSVTRTEVENTFAGGATLYLQKPSSFQLLVIALKKILQLDWRNYIKEQNRSNFIFKHVVKSES